MNKIIQIIEYSGLIYGLDDKGTLWVRHTVGQGSSWHYVISSPTSDTPPVRPKANQTRRIRKS